MCDLKKFLEAVRTGDFNSASESLVALGAPEPKDKEVWTEKAGEILLGRGQAWENTDYLQFVSLASETYDYFGMPELSEQCLNGRGILAEVEDSLNILSESGKRPIIRIESRRDPWRLVRQKLYVLLQASRIASRQGSVDIARKRIDQALQIAPRMRPISEGLIADAQYRLGSIERHESRFNEAITAYGECLEMAFERLERKRRGVDSVSPVDCLVARYLIGKSSALGLGYCFIERGLLREAQMVIRSGEMLLSETKDHLNRQYCELLYARLLRHRAGREKCNQSILKEANDILDECINASKGHRPRFVFRTHYELGFVHLYSGRFAEAGKCFDTVLNAASGRDRDRRWWVNATVAKARLCLYQNQASGSKGSRDLLLKSQKLGEHAEKLAKALKGDSGKWVLSRAILMQARAELALATHSSVAQEEQKAYRQSARQHLIAMLEMVGLSNPAVRAMPLLLLARLSCLEGDVQVAKRHFEAWKLIRDQVQYTAIHSLGVTVENEINEFQDFVVSAATPDKDLNWKRQKLDLERYIFNKLQARKNLTNKQRAEIWGGNRQAYLRRRKQMLGR